MTETPPTAIEAAARALENGLCEDGLLDWRDREEFDRTDMARHVLEASGLPAQLQAAEERIQELERQVVALLLDRDTLSQDLIADDQANEAEVHQLLTELGTPTCCPTGGHRLSVFGRVEDLAGEHSGQLQEAREIMRQLLDRAVPSSRRQTDAAKAARRFLKEEQS